MKSKLYFIANFVTKLFLTLEGLTEKDSKTIYIDFHKIIISVNLIITSYYI